MAAEITCVVDDADSKGAELRSEHGLSFWIETEHGCVLFDTGQTEAVLSHNLSMLSLDPARVDALVFSHAHYDHTGGMGFVLSKNPSLTFVAHPDIFRPRYALREENYESIGMTVSWDELPPSLTLTLSDAPVELLPGLWTTGEIKERSEPEGRSANHVIQGDDGWLPDPYRDDLSLVLETPDGLVLICGCCHAGLLNTLAHVRRTFDQPVIAVLGGTHLGPADDAELAHVIEVLDTQYEHLDFYLNHCTGNRATQTLMRAFGSRVKTCPVGTVVCFTN